MNNNIINNIDFLNGLNINPIPLEFTNALTTTKWLLAMQAKLTEIMVSVNGWYDTISNDLVNGGVLYQMLIDHVDSEFTQQLDTIHTSITSLNNLISAIESQIAIIGYVEPTISFMVAPSQLLYRFGETINSAVLNFNVIKGSNNLVKAEIYKNGVLLSTVNAVTNGANSYTDGNVISVDTSYYIKIYDDIKNISSVSISYKFVNNVYVGVVNDVAITNTLVSALTSLKVLKGDIPVLFSPNSQKIVIAYPAVYGILISILGDNEELIESFNISSVIISGVTYSVYSTNDVLFDTNHELIFKF